MDNKLYIGNLSYKLDENTLASEFGAHGTVKSIKIITDYETGRSKGFGFVEMETEEEAQTCIDNLNGKEIDGRAINVNIARKKPEGSNNRQARY